MEVQQQNMLVRRQFEQPGSHQWSAPQIVGLPGIDRHEPGHFLFASCFGKTLQIHHGNREWLGRVDLLDRAALDCQIRRPQGFVPPHDLA